MDKWMAEAKRIAGDRWPEFDDEYSFDVAWRDGLTPEAAVEDCAAWLDGGMND